MYIVWDKVNDRPYDKDGYGHFKIYSNKKAARRYIGSHLKYRCEVREVSHVAFTEGGFI